MAQNPAVDNRGAPVVSSLSTWGRPPSQGPGSWQGRRRASETGMNGEQWLIRPVVPVSIPFQGRSLLDFPGRLFLSPVPVPRRGIPICPLHWNLELRLQVLQFTGVEGTHQKKGL